jgi:23S rRNA (adenine2503-C2)-methyltransferase
MTDKIPLAGLLPDEIAEQFSLSPSYRGKQIFSWVQKPVTELREMTNVPARTIEELSERSVLFSTSVNDTLSDTSGTVKLRVRLADGHSIESVLLTDPADGDEGRRTACVSSQAGCGMGCAFCKTATMGIVRDLETHEIVEQYLHLSGRFGRISNIVFMGMGEPLLNVRNVGKAIEIFHHPAGNDIGMRRITISTCGIVRGIRELAETGPYVRLAFSLVTADESLRRSIMPVARMNPLDEVKKALIEYQRKAKQRVTIEIVLLGGVNDRDDDVEALARVLPPLDADVNLIPWNHATGIPFERPKTADINRFNGALESRGIRVVQRYQKGDGIGAACGQLATEG